MSGRWSVPGSDSSRRPTRSSSSTSAEPRVKSYWSHERDRSHPTCAGGRDRQGSDDARAARGRAGDDAGRGARDVRQPGREAAAGDRRRALPRDGLARRRPGRGRRTDRSPRAPGHAAPRARRPDRRGAGTGPGDRHDPHPRRRRGSATRAGLLQQAPQRLLRLPLLSIPSPTNGSIGPFHAYGLLFAVAVVAAVMITKRRWDGDAELVDEVALWAFPAGLIGGRLYHVITSWNEVPHTWWGPFAVWKGGLGIWGGIALGVAVGLWRVHRRGENVAAFMDAGAPALLVAQSIGRVGNWFNQELFGKPTDLPWGLEIDPENRPEQYATATTFHPTFLYEIIWNLSLAAFLVWLGRTRDIRPPGLFALYVAGYSAFRIFEETIRIDPAHHFLGLRLNLFVAVTLTVVGLVWFTRSQRRPAKRRAPA